MPPKLPLSTKLMSMMPPDEHQEWRDRAIASSPWGGGMYGLAESLRTPVIAPHQGVDAQIEGEYRQSRPSDMEFYNDHDMNVMPISSLAQALTAKDQPQGFDEGAFQSGIRDTDWFRSFVKKYGEEPNLDAKEYDYRKAWASGIRPQPDPYDGGMPHWPSALPSGEMLKSTDHPTAWKEYFMREYGVNPDALPSDLAAALRGGKY